MEENQTNSYSTENNSDKKEDSSASQGELSTVSKNAIEETWWDKNKEAVKKQVGKSLQWLFFVGSVAVVIAQGFSNSRLREKNEVLEASNEYKSKRINDLESLCERKDAFFAEMMSDGLRHGSSLAAKHMADRREYLNDSINYFRDDDN